MENFFAKPKQYRAIATRYDKTVPNFLGAIHLAASVIWLNSGRGLIKNTYFFTIKYAFLGVKTNF